MISEQWRSQWAVTAVVPLGLDSDKNIVVSVVHTTSQSRFSFYEKRSVA